MILYTVIYMTVSCVGVMTRSPMSQIHVRIDEEITQEECHRTLNNLDIVIRNTVQQLSHVTQDQVNKVMVTLPSSWTNTACVLGLNFAKESSVGLPTDVLISNTPFDDIKTVQFGGCGVKSRRVVLPHHRLHAMENETEHDTSTELFRSLLKHEFGYFDTHGRVNDLRFPEMYKVGEEEYENCNTDPFSDRDYNTEAPTKQNLLCQEQSPMSVITSNRQINGVEKSNKTHTSVPIVEYVIHQSSRHLLVLDRSTQSKHVWKHLHHALYRYKYYYQEVILL